MGGLLRKIKQIYRFSRFNPFNIRINWFPQYKKRKEKMKFFFILVATGNIFTYVYKGGKF